jgi:hypothetical protein
MRQQPVYSGIIVNNFKSQYPYPLSDVAAIARSISIQQWHLKSPGGEVVVISDKHIVPPVLLCMQHICLHLKLCQTTRCEILQQPQNRNLTRI